MKGEEREAIIKYSYLQAKLETLLKEREEILERIEETEGTISSLNGIKKNIETFFSLGSGVYCKGEVTEENFLVNIGAKVFLELSKDGVIDILKRRIDALRKAINEIEDEIENIVSQQKKLEDVIRRVSK
jgi:prefoldin alpha subunit